MNIKIRDQAHSTKTFINVLNYLNEVIKEHGLCGNFNFANLEDLSIAREYGLTKINNDGIRCMSNAYYDCIHVMEKIGILIRTDSSEIYSRATKFSVDKNLYLTFLCLCMVLEDYSNKQIKLLNRKGFSNHIVDILIGICNASENLRVYSDSLFNILISRVYNYLGALCLDISNKHMDYHGCLNEYVMFYISNSIYTEAHTRENNNDNIPKQIVPFSTGLSITWFSNRYLETRKCDKLELEEYYEKYLKKNAYTKKLLDYLDKKLNRISLEDIEIDLDTFNSIPGRTISKKKEILEDIVHYFVIKKSPLVNECIKLTDNLKDKEENYRTNVHVKVIDNSPFGHLQNYRIHITGRTTNDFCSTHKMSDKVPYYESREYILDTLGFDGMLDTHSTIFSIMRCLNNHLPFNSTYDIKLKLEELNIKGKIKGEYKILEASDFKGILFYIPFNDDFDSAWNYYKNRYNAKYHRILKKYDSLDDEEAHYFAEKDYLKAKEKLDKYVASVGKRSFRIIYNFVQLITGGTSRFRYNVFFIESCFEGLVLSTLKSKGYSFKNVYDAYYWNTDEFSREELEQIIEESFNIIANKYYSWVGEYVYTSSYASCQVSA